MAALTILEAGQPLAFVSGQLLRLAQPALALLWPTAPVKQFAQIMEDPAQVDELMARLATEEVGV